MPLSELERHRLDMLISRFVDEQYVSDYYGITGLSHNQDFLADLEKYRLTLRNPPNVPEGCLDRYVLEGFFGTSGLLPKKWAAARLGLKEPMLDHLLERRADLPIIILP